MALTVVCFACGTSNAVTDRVGRREECLKCLTDLHVCKNCEFYDVSSYNECRESSAERVVDKEKSHLCEYFKPFSQAQKSQQSSQDLRAKAEALFKKKK